MARPARVQTPRLDSPSPTSELGLNMHSPAVVRPSSSHPDPSLGPSLDPRPDSRSDTRSYRSDGVNDNDVFLLPLSNYHIMLAITVLAAGVRLFRIYQPSSVVFDEVQFVASLSCSLLLVPPAFRTNFFALIDPTSDYLQPSSFGGFATKYIKGKFFMDVHPPLAKLLIALAGWLAGFKGDFDFKAIRDDYLEPAVPYVAMRMFPALCGIFLAPAVFLTLKASGCRTTTAALGAGFIIFENGLLTQARLILLDSPLMAGTAFTILAFTSFTNQHELGPGRAFHLSWWFWLIMTGLGLGITVSIKWVGLFAIAWVGILTVIQLWVLLADAKNVTLRLWFKHFLARALCLIGIPLTFYMTIFAIHFMCLVNPGDGDGFMSSEFQATLNNKGMQDMAADVVMGSRVTIRHFNTQGGYLHSHPLMYPGGSKQQQITLYPHKDENNIWLLENQTQPLDMLGNPINGTGAWDNLTEPVYVKDGSILRLFHSPTHRRLHSHDVRPPITEADWQNEVTAYGYEGFDGDANDMFRVEIVQKKSTGTIAKERVRAIDTKFRLVHIMTSCVLFSHQVKLPAWASEQQEVTCARGGSLPNSLWYVESNEHPQLGHGVDKVNYRNPGFLGKFLELQRVMWKTNAGLVNSHKWDSRPPSWPLLQRGINFWEMNHRQIYLMGNPLVWWSSTLAVATYIVFKVVAILRWQRSCNDYAQPVFKRFDYEIGSYVLGWALHYFPFFLMERQLFLHHYFPALLFAVLAFCQTFDFATARIPSALGWGSRRNKSPLSLNQVLAAVLLILSAVVFGLYAPLAYGNPWTKAECRRTKLLSTWDFNCNDFYDTYTEYALDPTYSRSSAVIPTPAKAIADAAQAQNAGKPQDVAISGAADPPGQRVLSREEKVEYRDQAGNLLNEEQVRSLKGKVEFKTRYETRTRMVDAAGNEVVMMESPAEDDPNGNGAPQQPESAPAPAPPHPDVEGVDRQTAQREDPQAPLEQTLSGDTDAQGSKPMARPGSEGNEATQ